MLRSIDWSDSSKIVSLYTRENGRLDVVAKGARRSSSRYRGVLESMNLIECLVYFSEGRELQNLGTTHLENSFRKIREDLNQTAVALASLELVQKLFRLTQPDQVFFDFLITMLKSLEDGTEGKIILWYFILKLASYLGFRPEFETCISCGEKKPDSSKSFRYSDGSVLCAECGSGSEVTDFSRREVWTYLAMLQKKSHKKLEQVQLPENKFNYTSFLMSYLNYHTEQNLEISALKLLNGWKKNK